jgi:ribonuclease Z
MNTNDENKNSNAMSTNEENKMPALSRRDALKLAGLTMGGLAAGGAASAQPGGWPPGGGPGCKPPPDPEDFYPTRVKTDRYSYFDNLPPITPWGKDIKGKVTGTKLRRDEMRITFMGSVVPMARRAQAEMSVFVEVGWDDEKQQPLDQFIFDFGCGVSANYQACGVGYGRMDKIFINHLHGDHVSDLIQVYGFGNGGDRKSPLYLWGNGNSGVKNPGMDPPVNQGINPATGKPYPQPNTYLAAPEYYNDGIKAFCHHLREALRWHTESQAFQGSAYEGYPNPQEIKDNWNLPHLPVPAGEYPDPPNDANALIPIELDWTENGLNEDGTPNGLNVAYHNTDTKAKVLHYPVIHCRAGSLGYKLEWTPPGARKPLTMVYSSDTKPEWNSIDHAINKDAKGNPQGVDVFIHEMAVAPEIWAMKNQGLSKPGSGDTWDQTVLGMQTVQNSSHTPQGAFGYMLSEINAVKPPRLAIATHFPTADDTVTCALESVQKHCPHIKKVGDQLVWSFDLMVIRVFPDKIEQRRAVVNDFSFNPPIPAVPDGMLAPKYHNKDDGTADPFTQIDIPDEIVKAIPPTQEGGPVTYDPDGY